jgi:hypothetical protein
MGVVRANQTRTQKNIISYYKTEIKKLKELYELDKLDILKNKISLLERLRPFDYEVNNILPLVKEREMDLKERELDYKIEVQNLKDELMLLKAEKEVK